MSSSRRPTAPRHSQICWILDDDHRTRRAEQLIRAVGLVVAIALCAGIAVIFILTNLLGVGIGWGTLFSPFAMWAIRRWRRGSMSTVEISSGSR